MAFCAAQEAETRKPTAQLEVIGYLVLAGLFLLMQAEDLYTISISLLLIWEVFTDVT